jgi:hypothetical protein
MSECKAYAGWPPMLLNKRSDRLSKTNFERKKNDGPLDALGGHHTRKLAGLLAINAVDNADYRCIGGHAAALLRVPDDLSNET